MPADDPSADVFLKLDLADDPGPLQARSRATVDYSAESVAARKAERKARRAKEASSHTEESVDSEIAQSLRYTTADKLPTEHRVFDDELVEGVIGKAAMVVLYGDSNTGKTFLAFDLAACVERGGRWLGRHNTDAGLVLYLATEAVASVRLRAAAYQRAKGVSLPGLVIVESPINLFDGTADAMAVLMLVQQIEADTGRQVVLIIGDTLARISAGANENAGQDMSIVLKHADAIRSGTGATFLWIHHCGKDAAKGMRGWSGMRAAIDTEIEITADDATGIRTAEITKQRDLPGKGQRIGFKLESVPMGRNKWGTERTSAVVVPADAPDKPIRGKRPSEVAGAITELLNSRAPAGMRKTDIVKHYAERYDRGTVYRELKKMLEIGRLHEVCGVYALKAEFTSRAAS